jgi:hypothetical protein
LLGEKYNKHLKQKDQIVYQPKQTPQETKKPEPKNVVNNQVKKKEKKEPDEMSPTIEK